MIFLRKFHMGSHGILTDSDHHHVQRLEFLVSPRKGAGLTGAAGGIIPGIEIEHHGFPREIRHRNGVAVLIAEGKVRGFHTDFQHRLCSSL